MEYRYIPIVSAVNPGENGPGKKRIRRLLVDVYPYTRPDGDDPFLEHLLERRYYLRHMSILIDGHHESVSILCRPRRDCM